MMELCLRIKTGDESSLPALMATCRAALRNNKYFSLEYPIIDSGGVQVGDMSVDRDGQHILRFHAEHGKPARSIGDWYAIWCMYKCDNPAARKTLHAWMFSHIYPGRYRFGLRRRLMDNRERSI